MCYVWNAAVKSSEAGLFQYGCEVLCKFIYDVKMLVCDRDFDQEELKNSGFYS